MLFGGDIVNDTYSIVEEIGSGGMGVVYLAYHLRLEKYVVMKKIKNRNLDSSFLRNEVDILKNFIIRIFRRYMTSSNTNVIFILLLIILTARTLNILSMTVMCLRKVS